MKFCFFRKYCNRLSTELGKGVDRFYVELRDRQDLAGNVTINVGKSVCSKSQETDASIELRAALKVVQSSFVVKNLPESEKQNMIMELTSNVYAVFNSVDSLKSVEFIGSGTI